MINRGFENRSLPLQGRVQDEADGGSLVLLHGLFWMRAAALSPLEILGQLLLSFPLSPEREHS